MSTLCLAILAILPLGQAGTTGFFYALDMPDQADRLYRIDIDEDYAPTVTPIGPPGTLGYPAVEGIVWADGRLLGFDTLLDVWLQIDTHTGIAYPLSENGAFVRRPFDMTYNPDDGKVYGMAGNNVKIIDPGTGEIERTVLDIPAYGITYVKDTVGGLGGLFTLRHEGLLLLLLPDFEWILLGGNVEPCHTLEWDPINDALLSYDRSGLYLVHQVTGDATLLHLWEQDDLGITINALTFVPAGAPTLPTCGPMDSDHDGDIDLVDYAVYQRCFTGEQE